MTGQIPPYGKNFKHDRVGSYQPMLSDTIYVLTASAMAASLRRRSVRRPYSRYVSAATFIGLGVYAALAGPRPTK